MHWHIDEREPGDEGFGEYHTITNGERTFRAVDEHDARWLVQHLNNTGHLLEHNRTFGQALSNIREAARKALGESQ